MLSFFLSFFLPLHFRWVILDGMASVAALHANQRPSTPARRNDRAQSPFRVLLCRRRWWGKCRMHVLPFLPAEDQGNSKHLFTLLLFFFFPSFHREIYDARSAASHQKTRSNIVRCHCASVFLCVCVRLCKHKFNNQWPSYFNCSQTQSSGGGKRINSTALFLHRHRVP